MDRLCKIMGGGQQVLLDCIAAYSFLDLAGQPKLCGNHHLIHQRLLSNVQEWYIQNNLF